MPVVEHPGQTVMSLSGQRIVVVGGGSGIGLAVAKAAHAQGARVALVGRSKDRLQTAVKQLGADVEIATADARDPGAIAAELSSWQPIDHLVLTTSASASGLGVQKSMADMPLDAARAFFDGKLWSQVTAAQAALRHLSPAASITFTSGVASRKGLPNHTIIAANNAAIEALAKQLAREIAPRRVNVVAPGLTATGVYDHLAPTEREAFLAHVTAHLPIPRPATPDEIATAYMFAMTATYLTGAVIDIDGGLLVH
jgi:NAD(P)-dependent dehydrogenase (short-subunit alcohol dehydrogenase family)